VDGAIPLFEYLNGKEIQMTIATASEITNLEFFNEQFGLDTWFDMEKIVFDDFKIKGKPWPDMIIAASKKMDLDPAECIIFEDSTSGIQAAKAAGIARIIVIDPSGNQSSFNDHPDVDLVIPDFTHFNASSYF
jgi:beta-phosphoglucomutase-like phosphatase (HAD superfamily)